MVTAGADAHRRTQTVVSGIFRNPDNRGLRMIWPPDGIHRHLR